MRMYDIIQKKRNGGELSSEEIAFFINRYTNGQIPDYQASALMMAIYFRGMTDAETVCLTECMADSGDRINLSRFGDLSADKHSTGGVGDKTSLIVAPIVAALGVKIAKMSGRGLGHTGGTVDKLESVSGYKTELSPDEFIAQVERVGMAIIGQTGNLAPADKKLYALRDVTATVESIPLITSSIMSKKLAAGASTIVLDVKVGSGAFMKTERDAELLAESMVNIGKKCGRKMAALITDMNSPLGNNIGNSLEIVEAVELLKNKKTGDLRDVCKALASQMVSLIFDISLEEAEQKVEDAIVSGLALSKMREWIEAQGGDSRFIDDPSLLPTAKNSLDIICETDGYITSMNAEKIGIASVMLGAGRESKEDTVDLSAGIVMNKKVGDRVSKGDLLATLYYNDLSPEKARDCYLSAVSISGDKPTENPLIYKTIR